MGHRQLRLGFILLLAFQTISYLKGSNDSLRLPAPWQSRTFENGLQVVVRKDASLPISVVNISIRAGSLYESSKMSGWTALIAGLMSGSNRMYPTRDSFKQTLLKESILHDHFITPRSVSFRFQGLSEKTEAMIAMLASATQAPAWNESEINDLKSRMLNQAEDEMKDPLYYLRQTLEQKVWGNEAHRRNPAGIPTGLVRADSAGLYAFRKPFWVPYRCVLIISGPQEAEELFALAYKYWGRWLDAAQDPDIQFPPPEWPEVKNSTLFVVHQENTKIPVFMAQWKVPNSAIPYAELLTELLNLKEGRFRKAFQDTLKIVDLEFQLSNGAIYCTLVPEPKNYLRHSTDSLLLQFRRMCEPGFFTAKEIDIARRNLYIRQLKSHERISDKMSYTTRLWADDYTQPDLLPDEEKIRNSATQTFLKSPLTAGFISNHTLTEITGMRDFFYELPDTAKLTFSLEGDSLMHVPQLDTFMQKSGYFLRWSPASRLTMHVFIPSKGMNDAHWETMKSNISVLTRQAWLKSAEYLTERSMDVTFKFIKDPEAYIPGFVPVSDIPASETPDAYQFYIIPEYVPFDQKTF
jgi:predicted Zn-dependent peptidase